MSKAFNTVNHHTLVNKLTKLDIPTTVLKFTSNYIKGRKQYVEYQNCESSQRITRAGVPQGGVLTPTLFNIYVADLPESPPTVKVISYADDITILSSHINPKIAEQQIQPYLEQLLEWTEQNSLNLNASKTTATLFTPDPAQYNKQPKMKARLPRSKEITNI